MKAKWSPKVYYGGEFGCPDAPLRGFTRTMNGDLLYPAYMSAMDPAIPHEIHQLVHLGEHLLQPLRF